MKVVIQSVESRAKFVDEVLKSIPSAEVYVDRERRGVFIPFLEILRANPDGLILLQDDVIVCDWFLTEAEKAIISGEHTSFCVPSNPWVRDAYEQGFSYIRTQHTVWGQANYYPAWMIRDLLEWIPKNKTTRAEEVQKNLPYHKRQFDGEWQNDDLTVKVFLQAVDRWSFITVPNLANHRYSASTLGHRRSSNGKQWVSFLFGKKYLRPWDKQAVAEWSVTRKYKKNSAGQLIFTRV